MLMERETSLFYSNHSKRLRSWLCCMSACNWFLFFSLFVKGWMSFRTQSYVCAREECAGMAPYLQEDGGKRHWAHLSHLLPVRLVLGGGVPGLGLLGAGAAKSQCFQAVCWAFLSLL